ncbi:alpha/beta hydrolase family protein [Streptomyces sp. NBC_01353]|uniref:alpha/beta hydrolase family protein n=1 Tax=Streptomyces sp. NBC_01353 TaxID=2903835 RepID=UPI002E364564|nr:alpha/beta hydrolase [Streptomyces sp. NBC_01353]
MTTPRDARPTRPTRPTGPTRRTVTRAGVLAAALALAPTAARAAASTPLRLPAPTGPYEVGATTLHLVDPSRNDPWTPAIGVREVMVTVLHPARTVRGCPRAPQLTAGASKVFAELAPAIHPGLPPAGVDWAATLTHSHTGAPVLPGRWPVLLYSPGGGDARTMGTSLAEELASHGWAVVTVDHPGDASQVEFPTERPGRDKVRPTVFLGPPDAEQFRTMIDTRLADVRFVLDRLEALEGPLGRALDLGRVGIYGHSAGGTTAAQTLYDDRRIAAAVNLEGYLDRTDGELFPVARYGVDRPLFLLGTDGFRDARLDRSWSAMLAHPTGRTRRRQLDDAAHGVFTDFAALVPQLHAAGLVTTADRVRLVGAIDPRVSVPAVRRLIRSYFARTVPLRGAQ